MFDVTTTLPQLLDPVRYRACRWDLAEEPSKRGYWIELFRDHFDKLLREAAREEADRGVDPAHTTRRGDAARDSFTAYLDAIAADPTRYGRLDILHICWQRERTLRAHGLADPYRLAKREADDAAMTLLPGVLRRLDAMDERARREAIIRGVFAGNLYDLGATKTSDMFDDGGPPFDQTLERLKPRPWFRDDLDAWLARLDDSPHRHALLLVDNAGTDVVLGMIPWARELLRRGEAAGSRVILAANTDPSLNDTTHAELMRIIAEVASFDAVIEGAVRDGRLGLIASGNGAPLIDLTLLSPELVRAVARQPIDLLVIEGMGRAIESNLDARFACDTLKLAMIKDEGVADAMGAELFDLMLRFEPTR